MDLPVSSALFSSRVALSSARAAFSSARTSFSSDARDEPGRGIKGVVMVLWEEGVTKDPGIVVVVFVIVFDTR